jgi:FdhD protein
MTGESITVPVRRVGGHQPGEALDPIAVEEPLEIRLSFLEHGERQTRSISITMRTPGADKALTAGFLLTEGIIRSAADIHSIDTIADDAPAPATGNVIRAELKDHVQFDIDRLQRHFYTTSSCGVCGKTSLEALKAQPGFDITASVLHLDADILLTLPAAMFARQETFGATGGLHAAAIFDAQGEVIDVREDVGRHNAVDKVVGNALLDNRLPLLNVGVLVSGRASFEIMQKVLMAGSPMVVAVGAPSSLAVEMAWEFDMTLAGFLRDGRFNVYAGPARVD